MDESQTKELWHEICFILHANKFGSISEEMYEQKIILSLEKMGWSQFRREIILKQNIQLGSVGTIIPDLIIKSLVENISFVIEVKKPDVNVDGNSFQKQLFSYMRQLKLAYGLLIGSKIQIYYDGNLNKTENPILLNSIEIVESDRNGFDFIRLFSKENFNYENIESYAENRIKEISKKNKYDELLKILTSPEYRQKLEQLITEDLREQWGDDLIEKVFNNIDFSIKANLPTPYNLTAISCNFQTPIKSKKGVEFVFDPPDEREFKNKLLEKRFAFFKIFYKDGASEIKHWNANNFRESSDLRGNINSKTEFRKENVERKGVIKAIFSITPIQ